MTKIECIPWHGVVAYCGGCHNEAMFDGNGHCYVCGCDHPFGEINDPEEDYEAYKREVQPEWVR